MTGAPATRRAWLLACTLAGALAGCGRARPVRIGVLADLTGRFARLNEHGRNGVTLAVAQRNLAGGVLGRPLQMLLRDTQGAAGPDADAARALLLAGVDVVIGPFSSGAAVRLAPLFDQARVLLLCPTSADAVLTGRDDHLLRLKRSTHDSAQDYAQLLHARGLRRVAMATDMRSPNSNGAWRDQFRKCFTALGGAVVADGDFAVAARPTVNELMRTLLAAAPDALVFVASAVDAGRLAQQAAKLGASLPMAAPDWADHQALFEVGGGTVEGMLVASASDVSDTAARYRDFQQAYAQRFGAAPSDRCVAAHDAVTVVADGMARAAPGESVRDAVLRHGPYQGVQQTIAFDRFGDAARRAFHHIVRNGRFERI